MKRLSIWILLAVMFLSLQWAGADASERREESPDPSELSLLELSARGSGCPEGSVATAISPDGSSFSVLFNKYAAAAGSPSAKQDKKDCELELEMRIPRGWSFTLASADYQGFANVEAGALALHQVAYRFNDANSGAPGLRGTARGLVRPPVQRQSYSFGVKEFRGPFLDNYLIQNSVPLQSLSWSSCGNERQRTVSRKLVIATSLVARSLTAALPRAEITLDSVDGSFDQRFGIQWKRCSGDSPVPPASETVPVYRAFNGRDNLLTTDPNEGARLGYPATTTVFRVFPVQSANTLAPLYRCVHSTSGNHFLSRADDCEGQTVEAILGFVAVVQQPGLVPLGRFVSAANPNDKLSLPAPTTAPQGRYRYERALGFVPPASSR